MQCTEHDDTNRIRFLLLLLVIVYALAHLVDVCREVTTRIAAHAQEHSGQCSIEQNHTASDLLFMNFVICDLDDGGMRFFLSNFFCTQTQQRTGTQSHTLSVHNMTRTHRFLLPRSLLLPLEIRFLLLLESLLLHLIRMTCTAARTAHHTTAIATQPHEA